MHGLIHLELQKFAEQRFGASVWKMLIHRAGVASEIYTPLRSYPDEQMFALVREAEALSGKSARVLLEDFGEFLVPTYLSLYGNLLKPEWRTLDVLEHTEETIHRVVRLRHESAAPPRLTSERTRSDEVVMTYDSPRKLCAVARGIARGIAKRFDEALTIEDRKCMHRGDPVCVIAFRREG